MLRIRVADLFCRFSSKNTISSRLGVASFNCFRLCHSAPDSVIHHGTPSTGKKFRNLSLCTFIQINHY